MKNFKLGRSSDASHIRGQSRLGSPTQWFSLIDLFAFGLCLVRTGEFPCYVCEYCLRVPLISAIGPGHIMSLSIYLGVVVWPGVTGGEAALGVVRAVERGCGSSLSFPSELRMFRGLRSCTSLHLKIAEMLIEQ